MSTEEEKPQNKRSYQTLESVFEVKRMIALARSWDKEYADQLIKFILEEDTE